MTTLLRSPLAATAAVIAGLLLMAIPLQQFTGGDTPPPLVAIATPDTHSVPTWITLKLLAPATSVTLTSTNGKSLLSLGATAAGDHEARIDLPIADSHTELILEMQRPDDAPESAVFITITPDSLEQRQAHLVGSGTLHDLLEFSW